MDEEYSSKKTDPVDIIICTRRVSRHLERECLRRSRNRNIEIYNNRRIFNRLEKNLEEEIMR